MGTPEKKPFLQIRLEGESVGPGQIGIDLLLRLISQLDKALSRTGLVLQGDADSVRRGPKGKSLKQELALDLVLLTHGSRATILGFERRQPQANIPECDLGAEILQKCIKGLAQIQRATGELPPGFDSGVLLAWRDLGILFQQGVSEIDFTLNHRAVPIRTTFNPEGFQQVQRRIRGPQVNVRTIEGRLLMADFKEHGTRCRIHPSVGEPVLCLFDDSKRDEVLENILHYVRVVGEAKEDPIIQKITSITISDIQRVEEAEDRDTGLLPVGTPLPMDFWRSPSIEELAGAQGVKSLSDVSVLFGTWPGEEDDRFEDEILALRREGISAECGM